jgi:hypothetical protein
MLARLGNVIYCAGVLLALSCIWWAFTTREDPKAIIGFGIAGFLAGWALRYILSGNKGFKF